MEEKEFIVQFRNGSFPAKEFNHEKHLLIAYLYLKEYELDKAIEEFCQDLKYYVKMVGAENKYQNQLTVASLKIIYDRMQKSHAKNFNAFLMEFPELKTNFIKLVSEFLNR